MSFSINRNKSQLNSFNTTIADGNTENGTYERVANHSLAEVTITTNEEVIIRSYQSRDGINSATSTEDVIAADTTTTIRLELKYKWFKLEIENGSGLTATVTIDTYLTDEIPMRKPLSNTTVNENDATLTKSILIGKFGNIYLPLELTEEGNLKIANVGYTDAGTEIQQSYTAEGHAEVALHDPILPFGAVHVENMTPIFQTDGVYGINSGQVTTVATGTGGATTTDSAFSVNTGTTIYSQGIILGRKRLRYRAGQGVIGRFTALFTAPIAYSYQLAGFGHAEDGVYVGYGNTSDLTDTRFGILYVNRGVRETRTLTVTVGATVASNVTITLNTVGVFTVPVTNASNVQRTVWEIANYASYTGWDAYPSGATVVFVRKSAGVASGTYSFSAGTTGAAASFAQTKAGAASTDTFIPQADWNGDKLDGTGASGVTLNKTKLNIFQIYIGYLGTNEIILKAKIVPTGSNNATWVTCHTIKFPNTLTMTSFGNPAFPFTMAAYSAGSTTDLTVKCGSFAGFIEGQKMLHGNRFTYFRQLTTVGDTNFQALFTILNTRYYAGRTNQAVINLLNISGAIKHTSPVIYYLIKNGTLAGNPNFQSLASNSCSLWDTAATTVTYSTGDQLLATFHLGDTGEFDHHFGNGDYNAEEVTLQPGEWITVAARATTGTPSYVTGSINTREDQ